MKENMKKNRPKNKRRVNLDQADSGMEKASMPSPDRLEGRNPIMEALKAGRTVNKVWIARREGNPDAGLVRLVSRLRDAGAVILEVDRRVLDQMASTGAHQGIIAQVAAHEYSDLNDLLARSRANGAVPFLLVLDGVQDAYNLGSILRIADAAGVQGVIIPKRRSVGLDALVAKASAGAIESVPVSRVTNISQTLDILKSEGFWITGTDSSGEQDYRSADWTGPLAMVIGSEGHGISPSIKKHCDFLVKIPMKGQINSLNVAVATGIVVFQATSQRDQSG
jgi:23S rRNA (guanosine2251-2'-O)-methyltransferase